VIGAHSGTGADIDGSEFGIGIGFMCAHSGIGGNVGGCASPQTNEEIMSSLSSWAAIDGSKLSGCVQPSVPPPFSRSMIRMSPNPSMTILAHLTS